MTEDDFGCRPPEPLLCDADDEMLIAIDNGITLRDRVYDLATVWSEGYEFTTGLVREFNRIAMAGIYASAGDFRDRYCSPSDLSAPNHQDVPRLIDEMCQYANSHAEDPFHAAAYLLWRTNWIHPFYDGNGRVSRELCHLAVLMRTGDTWARSLPELIGEDTNRYISGLQAADRNWDGETPGVDELQGFISGLYCDHTTL